MPKTRRRRRRGVPKSAPRASPRLPARRSDAWTVRALFGLLRLVLNLLPILAFAAVAYAALSMVLEPLTRARITLSVLLDATIDTRLVLCVFSALLLPADPGASFVTLDEETRNYLYIWVRRFASWTIFGYAVPEAAWWLGAPGAIYALMAVGIGLVFGVLRLVNFAYGQLIMSGAFALALAGGWNWPAWGGILLCFAVVLVLSLLMEWLVFRPLRNESPAVMLVATFAVAFLLQNVGAEPVASRHGLLTTVAWKIGAETHYALEGSAFFLPYVQGLLFPETAGLTGVPPGPGYGDWVAHVRRWADAGLAPMAGSVLMACYCRPAFAAVTACRVADASSGTASGGNGMTELALTSHRT